MKTLHSALQTDRDGPIMTFECPTCPFHAKIDLRDGGYSVVSLGDSDTAHSGGTNGAWIEVEG